VKLFRKTKEDNTRRPQPSSSAPVFSYYASRSKPEQQLERGRQVEKRNLSFNKLHRYFIWQKLPIFLSLIVIVGSFFYTLSVNVNPRIIVISADNQPVLLQTQAVYRQAARELLQKSMLSRTKLTVDTFSIARQLKALYPELAEVSITVPLAARRLVFELRPATPSLVIVSNDAQSYIIDERGRVVVDAQKVESRQSLNLPLVKDDSGLNLKVGTSVLPRENIEFILGLLHQLEGGGLKATQISLPQVANELHVALEGQKYYVKFNMAGDARLQAGTLRAVKERLELEGRVPGEYIDVRVEEKVFYR
jgi:hypothetical protein